MFGMNEKVGRSYFENVASDKLVVTSRFYTLQGEGPYRGYPAYFIRLSKCNLSCSFCFVENTYITMAEGPKKKISEVKIGDEVIAYDEKSGEFKKAKVSKLYESETDALISIKTSTSKSTNISDKIYCTPEHPFLVRDKGWVEAQNLEEGDILIHLSSSEQMRIRNPMHQEETRQKVSQYYEDHPEVRLEASKRLSTLYNERPELLEALSERMINDNPMKDPKVALKGFLTREDRGKNHKTTAEKKFELATHGLPVRFVGHGDLIISHKVPDYVVEDQKKVIEVWSETALHAAERNEDWQKERADLFAKEGYETLFIAMPDSGVRNGLYDEIRQKVAEFIHNGETVHTIERIEMGDGRGSKGKTWVRLAGGKDNKCKVYNLEVEGYHTYVANGKVVHNCDTYFDKGDELTFDEIFKQIDIDIENFYANRNMEVPKWAKGKDRRIVLVITGGEPSLQTNLIEFLDKANEIFYHTQIESNGILHLDMKDTTYVVSPKCLEKDGVAVKYLKPNKDVLSDADCLKFVMTAPDNDQFTPYSEVPKWAHEWAMDTGKPIFVSPMNIYKKEPQKAKELRASNQQITIDERSTVDEVISFWEPELLDLERNKRNHEYTAEYAMKYGFILNLQIHLFASLP